MARIIVILEDNEDRKQVMRECLEDRFYLWESHFFDEVKPLKCFLQEHLDDTSLICLDHDLELKMDSDGQLSDPGTGRDVADFLATKQPKCPVIIHTTNSPAAEGMVRVLQEANWQTYQVCPFGDLEWITSAWFRQVRRVLVGPIHKDQQVPSR